MAKILRWLTLSIGMLEPGGEFYDYIYSFQ